LHNNAGKDQIQRHAVLKLIFYFMSNQSIIDKENKFQFEKWVKLGFQNSFGVLQKVL